MGFLKRLFSSVLGGGGDDNGNIHREYVRCSRCGEKIPVRVDLRNELTPQYDEGEGAFYVRKGIVGSGEKYCFQTIEVELFFNAEKQLVSRYISGGEFITRGEFDAGEEDEE